METIVFLRYFNHFLQLDMVVINFLMKLHLIKFIFVSYLIFASLKVISYHFHFFHNKNIYILSEEELVKSI